MPVFSLESMQPVHALRGEKSVGKEKRRMVIVMLRVEVVLLGVDGIVPSTPIQYCFLFSVQCLWQRFYKRFNIVTHATVDF